MAKLASSDIQSENDPIYWNELRSPSILGIKVNEVRPVDDWRTSILRYIEGDVLLAKKHEARSLIHRARNYCVIEGKLYIRALMEPLLRCLGLDEAKIVIEETHTGICGDHSSEKSMAVKILRQGFFWPSLRRDCEEFVKSCRSCQLNSSVNRRLSMELTPNLSPCPLFMWGVDIIGPFPKACHQLQYLIVAIDYTTKWVEAKLVARIRENEMIDF